MNKKAFVLLIALVLAITIISYYAFSLELKVSKYEIDSEKIHGGSLRLLVLADTHSGLFGENHCELLNLIEEQKPDVLLFAGDIMDRKIEGKMEYSLLPMLAEKYPCFYSLGNHEMSSGAADEIKEYLASLGIVVLDGKNALFEANGVCINICGVDDPNTTNEWHREQFASATSGIDTGLYTVLLSHRPEAIKIYSEYPVDLVLSGHAHGGQWRLPGIINGLFTPGEGLFPKYAGGLYEEYGITEIVSRGMRIENAVPRIFNPPEIVVVELY